MPRLDGACLRMHDSALRSLGRAVVPMLLLNTSERPDSSRCSGDISQMKLQIERLLPNPDLFEKAMKGPPLVLSSQYRLSRGWGAPRRSWGVVLFVIHESQQRCLGVYIVCLDLQRTAKVVRPSEAGLWGTPGAESWSGGRY